ncbi:MAG: bifunctional metallophosphatase/5'-nucleotidase [Bacteroides sp.]|nr:bifunctional metallophosphatase/5'-nucleotidase [Bacteroides sp.]
MIIKAAVPVLGLAALCFPVCAEKLVILHSNDTHSAIEPNADGTGGILQRRAVMDSVRKVEKNVITVDAGDVVQGSLYFKYFRGDVEYPLLNMMGYDIRILGNHEFDNGMADLAEKYKTVKGARLSANYDFTGTELEGVFEPYVIKKVKGKKIGFFGINIDPESLIAHKNISVNFKDPVSTANEIARMLKHEKGCDLVVAVTHIGYVKDNEKPTDVELANASRDIDIIIGGHSHTLIDPAHPEKYPSLIKNAEGKNVRVVQTGKGGKYLGKLTIDLDKLRGADGTDFAYELIPVTDRFPSETLNKEMIEFLKPYKLGVDSVNSRVIGQSAYNMSNSVRVGGMPNMTADFGYWYGNHKADSLRRAGTDIPRVDMAIMNVGGIRQDMPAGDITEGQILSTYPFSNHFLIVAIKGQDIIDALSVASRKGGEAVSGNVRVVTDDSGNLIRVVIDGEEMDPEKIYYLGTIDYVAEGNDDLRTLANHKKIWFDDEEVAGPMLRWFVRQTELGLPVAPDQTSRFVKSL